ncbi:hypothetical protein [Staphylococcus lutrae]|nr:hypothetical protein [Staphylococcus lutrae]
MRLYKRDGKWGYNIHYNAKRYRKAGYRTKKEAESKSIKFKNH